MTEVMPSSAPEEIRTPGENTEWRELSQVEFSGDRVTEAAGEQKAIPETRVKKAWGEMTEEERMADFRAWEAEKAERDEREKKEDELIALKKKAGRDIAVDVIRNPGKYEEIREKAEIEIAEIREKVRQDWLRKGASEEEARRRAREYDGRMSFFVTAKEAREWAPGKAGVQSVDAIYLADDVTVKHRRGGAQIDQVGRQAKHAKKERLNADQIDEMDDDTPVEIRMWADMEYMDAEMRRRRAMRKMSIAKRYEAVAEKMWPGDLDSAKRDAEWKKQRTAEKQAAEERGEEVKEPEEQFFSPVPEVETAEQATERLAKRLAKEEKMLAKDRETLEITLSGKMDAENKRRKVWNEERVKSDEKIVEDIKFQMAKIEETGDPVAAERALLLRWRDQEKAQIEDYRKQVKKLRFFQGAKKKELRGKIAELEKRQREYWPKRVEERLNISHNV